MGENQDSKAGVGVKRTTKDSVFKDLFGDKENLLKLYKILHPEDDAVSEGDLEIVTINNVLTDNLYNDLSIMAYGDRLLLLLEAQATWTVNILVRTLLYLAQTYNEYFTGTVQNLYGSKPVRLPRPELYVIYTGGRKDVPEEILLSEEFFGGVDADIEVRARVIHEEDGNGILGEYIAFCKVFDEQVKIYGMSQRAVEETIRICRDRNVLREYLSKKEKEVITIMTSLFDDERIFDIYVEDKLRDNSREVARETKRKSDRETAERMIRKGKMPLEDILEYLPSLSLNELKEIEAEVMQLN